ncbi:hypothetical protein V9K67_07500 [Paraflavisolibacter sp. H34]|uniref:hypothetical protein n=1 Tax=Huijunlia imazamoxiresistens TaxID=3127457 RepID=UPI00301621C5
MERVQVLIDKLVQLQKQGDSIPQMLLTVQLLQQELQALQQTVKPSGTKVAVVMPSRPAVRTVQVEAPREVPRPAAPAEPVVPAPPVTPVAQEAPAAPPQPEPVIINEQPQAEQPQADLPQVELPPVEQPRMEQPQADLPQAPAVPAREYYPLQEFPVTHTVHEPEPQAAPVPPSLAHQPETGHLAEMPHLPETGHLPDPRFDAVAETPTLVHHQPVKEIHELIGEQRESLNDKLKQEKVELAHLLKTTPIKDLRKAIGLNDKFAFINDLFRGDESMYERSIKTINGFHILQEAEYWINRELKVKLGWNDDKEVVQHFYHLVKRRFS